MIHRVVIELDDFGHSRALEEAERQGVTLEELGAHAMIYYLSDLDSGRVAAKVMRKADEEASPESGDKPDAPGGRFRKSPRRDPD
jgi:hypothetical protein